MPLLLFVLFFMFVGFIVRLYPLDIKAPVALSNRRPDIFGNTNQQMYIIYPR